MNTSAIKPNLRKIANFELQELIGTGGMANIYKGVQLSLERPVAIKVLHQHLTVNGDFVSRFKQEAKQAAILQHQNIVSIIDSGHRNGEYFIAMEYIDGQNLKEVLTRINRFPLEVAVLIAREVASGLKYAHSQGLIHRDIKPANIMLSRDGRVVITDFGIAKTYGDMSITVTGQTIGSPAYMSPEQAAGRPIDQRCDIFSLGIVMYEIITGEKPFKGDTYQAVMTDVISGRPPQPSALRVDVTPSLEQIMSKALMKDIESRYQDSEVMVEELNQQLSNFNIPSEKKVIAEFLKNPIRTTQKLRSDRISKHMESALYYVNIGHGRLSDAINEFENVLRYDKSNKLARQYLDKLKSGQDEFARKKKILKFSWQIWSMVGITVISLLAGIFLWLNSTNQSPRLNPDISGKISVSAGLPGENISSGPAQRPTDGNSGKVSVNAGLSGENISSALAQQPPDDNSGGQVSNPAVKLKAEPPRTLSQGSGHNYPDQDLHKFGLLKITSAPPAIFSVDFKEYGLTGGPDVKLPPGRHIISIEADGYRTERKRIFTETGETEIIDITLKIEY